MAHQFRLSSDILSPIHSDISLNDGSAYSFGSPLGTPDLVMEFKTPENRFSEKSSGLKDQPKSMKKDVSTLDMIKNNIMKERSANADKEEKFKTTYEQLKQSMDNLLQNKVAELSILSPISNNEKSLSAENVSHESKKKERKEIQQTSDKLKVKNLPYISEYSSEASKKKSDGKYEKDVIKSKTDKEKYQAKNVSKSKESIKKSGKKSSLDSERVKPASNLKESKTKCVDKLNKDSNQIKSSSCSKENLTECSEKRSFDNELGMKGDCTVKSHRTKHLGLVSSSTQTCESLIAASLHDLKDVSDEKKVENLLSKYDKHRRNIDTVSDHENKGLCIEKSIQIAVGIEMDKVRGLMLDQNNCLMKEMFKLQETAKKQSEVTEYLFSIIQELLEENKRLISNHN